MPARGWPWAWCCGTRIPGAGIQMSSACGRPAVELDARLASPPPPRPRRFRKALTQPPDVPSGEGRLARLAPHGGLNGALGAPAASTLLIASSPKQCKQAGHAEHRSPLGSGVSNKLGRGAQVTSPQWDPRCWGSVRPLGTAPHSVSRLVQGERSSSR